MKEQTVLSKLFLAEPDYSINNFGMLNFKFRNKNISVDKGYFINIHDNEFYEVLIRFCEIKEIEVENDKVIFILQDAGYGFKDGDTVEVLR